METSLRGGTKGPAEGSVPFLRRDGAFEQRLVVLMGARLTLRTVATWYATTHSDAARTALRDARVALGRAGELLTDRAVPAGLRQVYTGFLGFDATDPATAGEWVAEGGY